MSVSVRADGSGTFGALQLNGVDKFLLNADSTLSGVASPATGIRTNVLATMQKFTDEFGASLGANGYQKLPSGLIIQWGSVFIGDIASNAAYGYTLPIAFPNAHFQTYLTQGETAGGAWVAYLISKNLTSFTYANLEWAAIVQSATLQYFSIGR